MNITVCICSYNNARLLGRTIESLRGLDVPDGVTWELLVVNNNCSDDTDEVVTAFAGVLPLRYEHEQTPGKSHALNHALGVAQGELVIFADDDVKVAPGWLAAYWDAYRTEDKPRYFGGRIVSEHAGYEPDTKLLEVAMASIRGLDYGDVPRPTTNGETFIGSNWACPLAAMREIGGFDTTLGLNWGSRHVKVGEETHIMRQLQARGYEAFYVPGAEVLHDVPERKCNIRHVLERSYAWGYFDTRTRYSEGGSNTWFGVPRWLFRSLLQLVARVGAERVTGGKAYANRILLAQQRGRIAAYRDMARAE